MRLIGLLIVLAIIGLLTARQLTGPTGGQDVEATADGDQPPRVPQRAEDLPEFEREMHRYTDDIQEEQRRRIEEATRQ